MAEYTINKIKFGNDTYNIASGSTAIPIASSSELGGIKVGSGLTINSTTGVLSATGGGTADSVDWQNVTSKPTTISGYGITDASISNGTITLGSNTITPLTSHQDISGKVDEEVTSSGVTGIIDNTGQSISLNIMTGSIGNSTLSLHSTYTDFGTSYATVSTVNDGTPSTGSNYVILSASNNSNINQGVKVTPTQTIIKNIPAPTNNGDAANKKYVDDSVSGKANAATTIAGYGITDAKISNGTITLGSNTITPLTSETYTGTVTSVQVQATSPVTSSSSSASSTTLSTTIALSDAYGDTKNPYGTKTANYVLAGPTSGNAAAPSFRALAAADIPDLSGTYSTTDEKLKTASASNNTTYYPVFGTSTSNAETKFKDTNGFKYIVQSSTGESLLILGNGTSGTSNSRYGAIELYGTTTYSTVLTSGAPTAARTISLPNKSGTIALMDDIPDISNKADKSTTLAGYGITDAKIVNGTITLGSDTITPLTSETYTGTVTSVQVAATSPVVSSSDSASSTTLSTTISLADAYGDTKNPYGTKTANYVLAGPASGDVAAPSFRALASADIPDLSGTYVTLSNATEIAANTNLTTILTPGNYYASQTNSTTMTGTPLDGYSSGFELKVTKNMDTSSYIVQYLRYASSGTKYKQILNSSNGNIERNWYPENNEIHTLTEVNCSTSNTLAEVMAAMPRYSTLSIGWAGSGSGAQGSTTFGNDMPTNYGRLYAIKATGNYPWFAWFYAYNTDGSGLVWLRVYDTVNATHDTGWNVVATRTLNSNFEARVVDDTARCTIGANSNIKKYGTHVDANFDVTLSASTATGSSNYFATIPDGYRPKTTFLGVASSGTGTLCLITITTGGNVYQLTGTLAASTRIRGSFSWSIV